jgi:hypothetical protein
MSRQHQRHSQPRGTVDVAIGSGRALVVGGESYKLTVTNAPGTGLAEVRAGGVDITDKLDGGSIGGLLAVRDEVLPDYQAQLDQLAYDVSTKINQENSTAADRRRSTRWWLPTRRALRRSLAPWRQRHRATARRPALSKSRGTSTFTAWRARTRSLDGIGEQPVDAARNGERRSSACATVSASADESRSPMQFSEPTRRTPAFRGDRQFAVPSLDSEPRDESDLQPGA